jgi:hypothetical protein
LSNGLHNLTVYAKDEFENVGASETVYFTVAKEPELDPLPTTWIVAAATAIMATGGAAALIYFRKTKKTTMKAEK